MRPLISESYDSTGLRMTSALQDVHDPLPIATLILDGVIMLAGVGWLVSRALSRDRTYRWCGIEWGGLVIALAAGASCVLAGNRRLAMNGGVDWLSCALLSVILVQVLRDRWRVRLTLCVVLASASVQAAECFDQVLYTFPETAAMYDREKEAFWERQGVSLESVQVELFENRMRSGEATGYLAHGNIAGAYLVMCGLAAVGIGLSVCGSGANRGGWAWTAGTLAVPAAILSAAVLTQSRGALIGGALAAGLCAARLWFDGIYERHSRRIIVFGLAGAVCIALAVVGHGLYHGSLPGRSLDFRWKYWTASARMVVDHPLTGVGSGNFGRHYIGYKTIDSPEEVANPHNWMVSAATDWGVGGLVGMMLLVCGAFRMATGKRPTAPVERAPPTEDPPVAMRCWWCVILAAGIFGPRVALLGSDDPNYRYFATVWPLIIWSVAFLLLIGVPIRCHRRLATVLGFALMGFLLQDLVNFASLVPGTMTTAFALLGVLTASHYVEAPPVGGVRTGRPWLSVGVSAATLLVFAGTVMLPVWRSNDALQKARRANDADHSLAWYERAAGSDIWDPTPLYESARLHRALAMRGHDRDESIRSAIATIDAAIARDPVRSSLYREKSRCHVLRGEWFDSSDDRLVAIAASRQVLRLYPTDPAGHAGLAECLLVRGKADSDDGALVAARDHFLRALAIDEERPKWERIHRLRPSEQALFRSKIAGITSLLSVGGS